MNPCASHSRPTTLKSSPGWLSPHPRPGPDEPSTTKRPKRSSRPITCSAHPDFDLGLPNRAFSLVSNETCAMDCIKCKMRNQTRLGEDMSSRKPSARTTHETAWRDRLSAQRIQWQTSNPPGLRQRRLASTRRPLNDRDQAH